MIERVIIRRFKRFQEVTFDLPGHVVLAGPNNTGKSTVLQAIAAWDLALNRWKHKNDFQYHRGGYAKVPITRQAFSAVPLRTFDLLWQDRTYTGTIEIEISHKSGWAITMELIADSTEQVYVRPKKDASPQTVRQADIQAVYVPPMSGLSIEEPVYQLPKINHLLGQSMPGEVLRNLLVQAHQSDVWGKLQESISRLFHYELIPPDASGAHIIAEYRSRPDGPTFDIASAGSGFQQVLMLLTFLHTRPGAVLLLDEPDAHLHVILQDAIYGELRSVAAKRGSQLVMATHSEVIIDSVEPQELCMLLDKPRILESTIERDRLSRAMGYLTHTDVMLAVSAPGILYVEGYTDINILTEWAKILGHPAYETLTTKLFWKPTVWEPRAGALGVKARDHYEALCLVRPDLPGLILLDGDDEKNITETPISGQGLQRLRWKRYEIESYLLHPTTLSRFVQQTVGADAASLHQNDLHKHFEETYPPAFLKTPFNDNPYLTGTKARTLLLPPALAAAGLHGFPYTRFNEIAAVMLPEEIHPEVKDKLDAIQLAFRL